jgi:hypothetical protein
VELYTHAPIFLHGVHRDNIAFTFAFTYSIITEKILRADLKILRTNCHDTAITEHSNISSDTSIWGSYRVTLNPKSMKSALQTVVMLWQHQYNQQQLRRVTKQPRNNTHGPNCTSKSIHVPQSENYTAFNSLMHLYHVRDQRHCNILSSGV